MSKKNIKEKVFCCDCEHYDDWHGEEESCWKFTTGKDTPIYPKDRFVKPGNPFTLNKNNNCKGFEPVENN